MIILYIYIYMIILYIYIYIYIYTYTLYAQNDPSKQEVRRHVFAFGTGCFSVTLRQEISGRCIGAESCENGAAITSQVGYQQL